MKNIKKIQEIKQTGSYNYSIGPYSTPIVEIAPGEIFKVYTDDAFESRITKTSDLPSEKLKDIPNLNPMTGPIYVKGAEKGDSIIVEIIDIQPARDFAVSALIKDFGGLTGTDMTALLNEPLPEKVWVYPIRNGKVWYNEQIGIPYKPFYGSIATAPENEQISSLAPGNYGGNMDCPDVCVGNKIWLPVNVDGAYFYVGDAHANQGDGELCGVALEHTAVGTFRIELVKGKKVAWPRVESKDEIMVIGSARPMEDAARIAYKELIMWMQEDYGFDPLEAYQLLTQVGKLHVGNMVDTFYSLVAKCPKEYLISK
ncbi:acetamidase/formamidase family protein [Bacillus smithii]|uniref:acetamidase/formamidase family protein n=1 Tax=Bacillus smithii TaxID=1479 RepID=UPI002E1D9369|nr:acetamidase/formamidase family protein [Bacillus smithii]